MDNNQIFNQPPTASTSTVSENTVTIINYAGFWRRFAASFVDGIFLAIVGGLIGFTIGRDFLVTFSLSTILGLLYFGVFDSSEMMGSPGKALLGIVVATEDTHQRLTFKKAIIRHLLKNLSWLIIGIGYLMQPFTKKRQTLHDMMVETIVVRKDVGDINYFKAYKDNFKKIVD